MALDGAVLYNIKNEILDSLNNARIDRISQPSQYEIVLNIRDIGKNRILILSASSNNPRVHFLDFAPENPQKPPMFCMLLRKHLSGSRISNVRQNGMDRVLFIDLDGYNDIGDEVSYTLVVEIMGRHSNIILLDSQEIIVDSIKRIDLETSSVRQVLPGMRYELPPSQNKLNILTTEVSEIIDEIGKFEDKRLPRAILETVEGFSPLPCREIAYKVLPENDIAVSELTDSQLNDLAYQLQKIKDLLLDNKATPTMVINESGKPYDFSFIEIEQYGKLMKTKTFDSFSEMLSEFYNRRDTIERMSQRSGNLHRFLDNTLQRVTKRVAVQQEELLDCKNREQYRINGDLVTANIHALKRGDTVAKVQNFYSPDGEIAEIPLDPQKNPAQNAQHYYAKYRKSATAEKKLTKLIKAGKQEIEYIDSVLDTLKRAQSMADLDAIRSELIQTEYLKEKKGKGRKKTQTKQKPHTFVSSDGFTIYAGRNNAQNDKLSLRQSRPEDIWLHTQKIPGSHVIIETQGKEVPQATLLEAAIIAAYHSKAQDSHNVPVDYTNVKYVKKPSGARPGMVIYDNFKTLFVDPDQSLVDGLQK